MNDLQRSTLAAACPSEDLLRAGKRLERSLDPGQRFMCPDRKTAMRGKPLH
jgi:hypothetical protein